MKKRSNLMGLLMAPCLLMWASGVGFSQLIPASLEERITNAELVVEGEVLHSHSYYGDGNRIYTSHLLATRKMMKGSPEANTLEVVLRGGTVDGTTDWISHHLYLAPGDMGIFFLNPNSFSEPTILQPGAPTYDVYADLQGFIRYKEQPGATVGADPFRVYRDIEHDLYPLLGWQGGGAPSLHQDIRPSRDAVAVIDSIRPLHVSAGTRTELSIHGSGFLNAKGRVYFRDADDGGQTLMAADSTDIQEWTDTLIRLWVPSVTSLPNILQGTAGTGPVLLRNTLGDSAQSAETLVVQFAVQNDRDQLFGTSRYAHLIDQDSYAGLDTSGGYTFRLSSTFSATDSAENAFRKALRTWRCATGVDFKIGGDTLLNVSQRDSVNLVKWDDGPTDNLPSYILARTEARLTICVDAIGQGYFAEDIDLMFSRMQAWNFDTSLVDTTKWDFLSIALHELGHAHLLYHVIDTAEIMHHSLDSGSNKRILAGLDVVAGGWVMDSSVTAHGACPPPMIQVGQADCNTLPVTDREFGTALVKVFPNPASGRLNISLSGRNSNSPTKFDIFTASGIQVAANAFSFSRTGSSLWSLDIGSLANGMYFLKIETKHFVSIQKIIITR